MQGSMIKVLHNRARVHILSLIFNQTNRMNNSNKKEPN